MKKLRIRSHDTLINRVRIFTRGMPDMYIQMVMLFVLSVLAGIVAFSLANYGTNINVYATNSAVAAGTLTGLLTILIPALLTVVTVKILKRYVKTRYIFFVSLVAAGGYAVFVVIASALYFFLKNYAISNAVVLVGDASILVWWFFISRVVLGQKKGATVYSIIQPIFNVLLYAAAGSAIFTFTLPLSALLLKLSVGIVIFVAISYILLYILDSPLKRNIGINSIDVFSDMVRNWLFNIDVNVTKQFAGETFGLKTDIDTHMLLFKRKNGTIKGIMFAPWLHYGPMGTLGGSDFPYLLEKHSLLKYHAPAMIMHCTVNEDFNPVSSNQVYTLKNTFDKCVSTCKKLDMSEGLRFSIGRNNSSSISMLSVGGVGIATFSRAPRVTEDVSTEAGIVFKELFQERNKDVILIDAHNSRYESAPADELAGVKPNSPYMTEYMKAIRSMKLHYHSRKFRIGFSSNHIYHRLGTPTDIAPGHLNVVVFEFNGFKYAMIQLNCNNMLPNLRNSIVDHVRKKYRIEAEVYTTDTHFVNSLERAASNVLGRATKFNKLIPLIDKGVNDALTNVEPVDVYYKKEVMKNFHIWGQDIREKAFATLSSVIGIARLLVPIIIAAGFIAASLIVAVI